MPDALTLSLPNALDGIGAASDAATVWLEARHVPTGAVFLVNLAIEELVTNCVKYAYDDTNEHTIDVELSVVDRQLAIVVIDDGHAFNPLAASAPDLSLSLEQRRIGGLGIHLLRELADEMRYERRGGTNRVTLIKRLD